ncbi:Carboxylesterase [Staphylotrichum tortipilum]|uniref:Carboxylic ester hydrolase n=1 Tax=Staphylotrichum tortipilum TaxID=2831512 RepID=A0AAN6M9L3_9PEZI|nr:Carboxylesterase [Staphylotrichum longicolle]
MFGKSLVVLWALLGSVTAASSHAPTAVLGPGRVIGTTTALPSSTATVNKFLSIPYAVTPPRRFMLPERLVRYDGPVDATQPPHLCIQQNYAGETAAQVAAESEDCLYLNVYAPVNCKGGKAVMFYIHGGDLTSGTGGDFDGSRIAAHQDVVVVTINYRLNAFGFSNAPNLPLESRNVGFWDQRMALDWVQDNIAAFGGDPRKVTIFGESSGASSVDRLLTTILDDRPPFRAAIIQSGQATVSPFPNGGPAAWSTLVSALNCTSSSVDAAAEHEFACVQRADALTIRRIVNSAWLDFGPANDNVTQRATPFVEARQAGSVARVPLLAGSNGQEGMNLGPEYGITNFSSVTEDALDQLMYAITGSAALVGEIRPLIDEIQGTFPWYNLFQAGAQLYTEVLYQCPCKLVTEASIQDRIPTWRYYYNATILNIQPEGYPTLGAFHGSELALIWGNYPADTATDQEIALGAFLQTAWATFAKDPTGGPGWKALDATSDELACLGCGGSSGVQMISTSVVDSRCSQYAPLYTASTPSF